MSADILFLYVLYIAGVFATAYLFALAGEILLKLFRPDIWEGINSYLKSHLI